MADRKICDDRYAVPRKHGGGEVRREIWVDAQGEVSRYNLAYINHQLYQGDNGRVVGYDNAHGFHHRHYFGRVTPVEFTSFEEIEARFQQDWCVFRGVRHDETHAD